MSADTIGIPPDDRAGEPRLTGSMRAESILRPPGRPRSSHKMYRTLIPSSSSAMCRTLRAAAHPVKTVVTQPPPDQCPTIFPTSAAPPAETAVDGIEPDAVRDQLPQPLDVRPNSLQSVLAGAFWPGSAALYTVRAGGDPGIHRADCPVTRCPCKPNRGGRETPGGGSADCWSST